ncbi:nitroreductase/quinone reductase family protein [Nocardia sp. NPDC056100]|uniref:nitroreductase/quinone reductase family protein n=1 Tax=Nocardia sp. NPDC056100 TaxID=3345712 RepID=UPI0035D922B5
MATNAKPSRRLALYKYVNPVIRFLVRRGVGIGGSDMDLLRTLRVPGRSSGRIFEIPVRVAVIDGNRYIMTMGGDTQWARNLRASGTAQLLYRNRSEDITARELTGDEKTQFLTAVCQDPQFAARARSTLQSALGTQITDLGESDIRHLGDLWYPFQLTPAAT